MKRIIEISDKIYKEYMELATGKIPHHQPCDIADVLRKSTPVPEWIPIKEGPPPEGEDVLIQDVFGNYFIGAYFDDSVLDDGSYGFETRSGDILDIEDVVAYRSLPKKYVVEKHVVKSKLKAGVPCEENDSGYNCVNWIP